MANLPKRGDFQMTLGGAATVLQIRGIGYQGGAVLFWWNGRDGTADASGEVSFRAGWGLATDTSTVGASRYSSLARRSGRGGGRAASNDGVYRHDPAGHR